MSITKPLPIILFACLVCVTSHADEPKEIDLSKTHKDSKYGFSFKYPDGWTLAAGKAASPMGAYLFLAAPPVNDFAPNFNIVLIPVDNKLTSTTKEDLQKALSNMFRDVNFTEFEVTKFRDKDSLFLHYTATMGENNRLEMKQYLFNHKKNCVILTFTDTADHFKESAPFFEAIIDSFQFQ